MDDKLKTLNRHQRCILDLILVEAITALDEDNKTDCLSGCFNDQGWTLLHYSAFHHLPFVTKELLKLECIDASLKNSDETLAVDLLTTATFNIGTDPLACLLAFLENGFVPAMANVPFLEMSQLDLTYKDEKSRSPVDHLAGYMELIGEEKTRRLIDQIRLQPSWTGHSKDTTTRADLRE